MAKLVVRHTHWLLHRPLIAPDAALATVVSIDNLFKFDTTPRASLIARAKGFSANDLLAPALCSSLESVPERRRRLCAGMVI